MSNEVKISRSQAKTLATLIALGGTVDVTKAIPGINRAGIIGISKLGLVKVTLTDQGGIVEVLPAGRTYSSESEN